LLVCGILLIAVGTVQSQEMGTQEVVGQASTPKSALELIKEVSEQLQRVEDFKGEIRGKIYGQEETLTFRTKIMKSPTRSMTENVEQIKISNSGIERLLNTIPWLYLPPNYSTIMKTLPIEGQLDYQKPLEKLEKMYQLELLGETTHRERAVYIVQLKNKFFTQRFYIDKQWRVVSRAEVFNSSNIKIININYRDFKFFADGIWLPTKIEVKKALGRNLLEINYHELKVNIGLTNFDFAKGFQEDYQTKVAKLEAELNKNPRSEDLYWEISQIYKENNVVEKAIANLRDAIRIQDKVKYRTELAQLLQNQGQYKEAVGEIKAALKLEYDNAQLYYLLGELYLQLNNSDQAQYYLEKAVNLAGDNITYLNKLFWVYYNSADSDDQYLLEQAENIIEKLISLDAENEDYRIYSGDLYFDQGKLVKAAKAYQQAIDLAPQDTWGYIKLANFYQATDSYYKAEEIYRYVIYLDDSLANHRRLADLYFEYGKYKLALEQYQLMDERATNDYEIKLKLAETYFADNNPQQGLDICRQIFENFQEGKIYLEVTDRVEKYNLEAAQQVYYQAIQNKSVLNEEQEIKLYRGFNKVFFDWMQQIRLQELEQMVPLSTQGEIYRTLGKYQLQTGHPQAAVENLQSALGFTDKLEIHFELALSYLVMDDYQQVEKEALKLARAGQLGRAAKLLTVSKELQKIQDNYADDYLPGRLKRLAGDELRREGNLKQAAFAYKQAAFENYNYKLPYFYLAWIYSLQEEQFEVELATTGLPAGERAVLEQIFNLFSELEK